MKKGIFISIGIFVSLCFLLLKNPMLINDASLNKYQAEILSELALIEDVILEESISACCNSSGTGDHIELYVALLIKSTVDKGVLVQAIDSFDLKDTYCNIHKVEAQNSITSTMKIIDISFSENTIDAENFYIIEFIKSAPLSWLDFRGT